MRQRILAGLVFSLLAATSHAALLSRLSGQAYYDTVRGITWLANANLAANNSFGVPGIDGGANPGRMNWDTARSWINAMNDARHLGANNWRLPTTAQPDSTCDSYIIPGQHAGYGCAESEMGHLFNVDGIAASSPGFFTNVQPDYYWSGTEYAPDTGYAWNFNFGAGNQFSYSKSFHLYAWAVRDGDIDADNDGFADGVDNCTLILNPTQLDADGDGYGNICDADLNNSGLTTSADFGLLRSVLNQPAASGPLAAAADMNGSGLVTSTDFNLLRARLNTTPGPSGVAPIPPTAFRMNSMSLVDPHIYAGGLGCADLTNSTNAQLAKDLTGDANGDGLYDLSPVAIFKPLDQFATSSTLEYLLGACKKDNSGCTGAGAIPYVATETNTSSGVCADGAGHNPAYGVVNTPTNNCFTTNPETLQISLLGANIPLIDARIAAVYSGNPSATALTTGLVRGFLSKADADTIVLPQATPLVGGSLLSAVLGSDTNCTNHDDLDSYEGKTGWYFYLNFTADKAAYSP